MKKRWLATLLALTLTISGCGANVKEPSGNGAGTTSENSEGTDEEVGTEAQTSNDGDTDEAQTSNVGGEDNAQSDGDKDNSQTQNAGSDSDTKKDASTGELKVINTAFLGDSEEIYYDPNLVPSVPKYKVADDFSNVKYHKNFAYLFETEHESEYNNVTEFRKALIENSFAVKPAYNDEFFDVYENNRYNVFPNFVTVDSLMHTYHLYFSYLMKKTEKNHLADSLKNLSSSMMDITAGQYEELKGTAYEKAAFNNLVFFYIGSMLQDDSVQAPIQDESFEAVWKSEYDKIMAAKGIDECAISELKEDYSQYKPRGYYEGDEQLERYFRAMMWYGRMPFELENDDMLRSAELMTLAIAEAPDDWKNIYAITSFFAGASDDPGYSVFSQLMLDCYGETPAASELVNDDESFAKLKEAAKTLELPKINSVPVMETEENVIPSFRFMGQRFTIDAAIMQKLVYRSVEENSAGDRRFLPDVLDTAAALGSDTALSILEEQGETDYKNYTDNMTVMRGFFGESLPSLWNASLYSGWLGTLRLLFEKKGEGYPSYMQSEEWAKKDLETFAGSYTELKHDTILYAKQIMAEMGGGYDEELPDDRGYVDPEPVVYSRFIYLSDNTAKGLEEFGMLDADEKKDLELLSEIARKLLAISEKELKNESLTGDEYEFIRCYGGDLEHFWREVNKDSGEEILRSEEAPCPVVADIATDPNGTVLEVGTGYADNIYVVFPIDGELHVGSGSVYSFYQFEVPISQRMTDSEWRQRLAGGYLDDDFNWIQNEGTPDKPEWTMSYRISEK